MSVQQLTRRDSVFVLRLGDGENRVDREQVARVSAALDEIEGAEGEAALVTIGSDRFYSNGYDLEWLAALTREERRGFIRDHQRLLARLLVFPTATVAALSGHAFGAGALLALAHDFRLQRADRGYFCFPEVDARIPFRSGMMALLRSRLTPGTLRDAVLTGARYGGVRAAEMGIVDEAVTADTLLDAACARARSLAGKDRATLAALKRGLYEEAWTLLNG